MAAGASAAAKGGLRGGGDRTEQLGAQAELRRADIDGLRHSRLGAAVDRFPHTARERLADGAGVADTLFGRRRFTGTLPVSWPRTLAQEPINVGDASYDPLYPYGYGLRTHGGGFDGDSSD